MIETVSYTYLFNSTATVMQQKNGRSKFGWTIELYNFVLKVQNRSIVLSHASFSETFGE